MYCILTINQNGVFISRLYPMKVRKCRRRRRRRRRNEPAGMGRLLARPCFGGYILPTRFFDLTGIICWLLRITIRDPSTLDQRWVVVAWRHS